MVTAKLLVPSGAPLHLSAGDLFSPEHPNPLNSKLFAIVLLAFISGLESLKSAAHVKVDMPARATAKNNWRMRVLPENGKNG
jgi:hypothetical protein